MKKPLPRLALTTLTGMTVLCATAAVGQAAPGEELFAEVPRMLYAWNEDVAADWKTTRELVDFARAHRFEAIALQSYVLGTDLQSRRANHRRFVSYAHLRGVQVYGLLGDPWFTVAPDAGVPGQPTSYVEGWALYQSLLDADLRFDGFVDNSMPYLTDYVDGDASGNYFWESPELACQSYLDYLRGVEELIGDRPFHHAIPFWFDTDPRLKLALDGETTRQPLNRYVAQIVDVCNVMAYRDHALGADGIVELVLGELMTGPCTIGVELQDLGAELSHLTFWEEGLPYLESQLWQVWGVYGDQPAFRGFTLHTYDALRELSRP